MNKVLAIFDFDGTITTKDTMFGFLEFAYGRRKLLMGLIASSPSLILFKLGLLSRQKAKEKFLHYFFKNTSFPELKNKCTGYADEVDKILNPEAMKKLRWHREQGHRVIIISASILDWVIPWATRNSVNKVIATEIEVTDGTIAEKFRTNNCYGPEKVTRLVKEFPNIDEYTVYAYGDSNGDKELLAIAQHKFYRRFYP